MKKIIALIMVLAMLLSFAACSSETKAEQDSQTDATDAQPTDTTAEEPATDTPAAVSPVAYFSMTLATNPEEMHYLTAYADENGGCYVEYVGDAKKVATLEADALLGIANELAKTELASLNGQSLYDEGDAFASVYIQFEDESYLTADFSGALPTEFVDGYAIMDAYFQSLVADVPVYVPAPVVMGEVNPDSLAAIEEILYNSDIEALDSLTIMEIPMDEFFAVSVGLSSAEGITAGVSCAPMMMTTAYSCVIVTVEDAELIPAIREDFANNFGWNKWVCVAPNNALLAQKDNMILCLMGSGELFSQTKQAAENSGWTDLQEYENPNM